MLNREWSSISVVSALFVILMGTSAINPSSALATPDIAEPSGYVAVRYTFLATSTLSYIGSVTSCATSIFLLHASNSVPQGKLHAFLRATHYQLWVPLGGLLLAVVFASIALSCASLIIYQSWAAFAARLGATLVWLVALGALLASLPRAAMRCSPHHAAHGPGEPGEAAAVRGPGAPAAGAAPPAT